MSTVPDPRQHPNRTDERSSIDLSLELEHQLEHMELVSTHNTDSLVSDLASTKEKRESLDPHVLAHIIMQLRHSLTEVTKERDELIKALSSALSKEAELNDALQLMTDKATDLEEELAEAKKKLKESEEAITLLRSKVEESRRGLMRLQTESRRQSGNFEAARGAMMLSLSANPSTPKRASFAPLTGTLHAGRANGHKRLSSVSDTGPFSQPMTQDLPSPRTQDFPSLDPPLAHRHPLGVHDHHSPPEASQSCDDSELGLRRKELQAVKDELENTKHRLSESNEAREASEQCVKALRDFIAENNIGVRDTAVPPAVHLPLPPTMAAGEANDAQTSSGGWSFGKLWKADHSAAKPSISVVASTTSPAPQIPQAVSASAATPLTKKLGVFFTSRPNIPPAPSLTIGSNGNGAPCFQSNAALTPTSHRGSIISSDASSITEPVSLSEGSPPGSVVRSTELEFVTGQRGGGKGLQAPNETMIIR